MKNIIFDFGNVLFDLDFEATEKAFSEILESDFSFDDMQGLLRTCQQFEIGSINTETFIWRIQKKAKSPVQGIDIIRAWNSMLIGITKERFDFVKNLREKYKVYLLSNINELHAAYIERYVKKIGYSDFKTKCFDKVYYSHLIGMRKPNKNIYNFVLKDARLNPAETLFIDDNLDNVNSAKLLGIKAILHNPSDEIMKKMNYYLKSIK